MAKLIPIHVVPVAANFGWLVSSRDERWDYSDTQYFEKKFNALKYAKQMAVYHRGGSVKIHGRDGEIKEERTYPRSRDPRRSKG